MRCSEPGHRVQVASHASRGPGRWVVRRHEHARVKRFATGFLLVLLAFGVANFISYYVRTDMPGAADAIRRAGFPFLVWEEGGFAYRNHFSQAALLGDIAVAVCLGSVAGVALWRF